MDEHTYTVHDACRILADVRKTIRCDLQPLVDRARESGRAGMFTLPAEVFASIDFLGALYAGYEGETDRSGRRRITNSEKAGAFLETVFGKVDNGYAHHGRRVRQPITQLGTAATRVQCQCEPRFVRVPEY